MRTVLSINKGLDLLNRKIDIIIITGGGRKNLFILNKLNQILIRENRMNLYSEAIKFIKTRVDLELAEFTDDIWSH